MKLVVIWVKLYFAMLFAGVQCSLSETEWKIFTILIRQRSVKNILAVSKIPTDTWETKAVKKLSTEGVFTIFLKRQDLRGYLENLDGTTLQTTAVVLNENNFSTDFFENKGKLSSYLWFIFASNETFRRHLAKIEIPFDCPLLLIEKVAEESYAVSEYYQIQSFAPGIFSNIGYWRNNIFTLPDKDWTDRKSNMKGYPFKTVKFNENLYITPKDKVNEEIWRELSNILNFTIVDKVVEYTSENGPVALEKEEGEALLDTQIYLGTSKNYTYLLGPTSETKLYMHVKPSGEDKGLRRFIKPFSKSTWWSIGIWLLTCGFAVTLVERLLGKAAKNRRQQNESRLVFFTPLYSLCNQSGVEIGSNVTSILVLFLIRISALVVYYAYSATFVSYLLLFMPKLPFTDLNGLIEDGSYRVEGERNSDADTYFSVSSNPLEKIVYEKFFSDVKKWSRFDKGVDRMCAGEKLVLVGYDNDLEKYKPCNIVKIKKPLKIFANGFKIKFKSPFRGILHVKLLLMRNTGILQRVNSKIISINVNEYYGGSYEINTDKVYSVFILFAVGCSLSIGVLFLEIVYSQIKKKAGLWVGTLRNRNRFVGWRNRKDVNVRKILVASLSKRHKTINPLRSFVCSQPPQPKHSIQY